MDETKEGITTAKEELLVCSGEQGKEMKSERGIDVGGLKVCLAPDLIDPLESVVIAKQNLCGY
jgi:hypothetical protein